MAPNIDIESSVARASPKAGSIVPGPAPVDQDQGPER